MSQEAQKNITKPNRSINLIKDNPHLLVSICLFVLGGIALWHKVSPLAGSLFGAGGALLGSWITELNKRRVDSQEKIKRESLAIAALSPELQRSLERLDYILSRATVNFICESSLSETKPTDSHEDFKPYFPILYPNAPQVRDLPSEKTIALIRYYDSLNELSKIVEDWWEREGQLAVSIFNVMMHSAEKSAKMGIICIKEFELEENFPPPYESWDTLTSRIERSLETATLSRNAHIERYGEHGQNQKKAFDINSLRSY